MVGYLSPGIFQHKFLSFRVQYCTIEYRILDEYGRSVARFEIKSAVLHIF